MRLSGKVLFAAVLCALGGYYLLLMVLARTPAGAGPSARAASSTAEVPVDPHAARAAGDAGRASVSPGPRIVLSPRSTTSPDSGGSSRGAASAAPSQVGAGVDRGAKPAAVPPAPVDPFVEDLESVRRRQELMGIVVAAPDQVAARLRVEPEDVHRVAKGVRPLPQLWIDRWFAQ